MSTGEDLSDVFLRLAQTSSVEAALSRGVRLACRAGGALAGAIVVHWEPGRRPSCWFRHDPQGLLEQTAFDPRVAAPGSVSSDSADARHSEGRRGLTMALSCGRREAGWLVLVADADVNEEKARCRLIAITAALAALLLAVERDATGAQASILGPDAFRAALSAQIARSERQEEAFAVLHVRAAGLEGCAGDNGRGPWSEVAWLGEALLARLRRTDLIGLMAPDQLAVLLPGTGRLGAIIAARRIELLLSAPQIRTRGRSVSAPSGLMWCVRAFPEDAESAPALCEAVWQTDQTPPTGLAARAT
jgi:hypothetical protein